jgi:outer membrane protein assembly factor BamB
VWQRSYEARFRQDESALAHGQGPYSTPALADGRLFTFSVTAILNAWDAATGELLWKRESAAEFDPSFPYFGAAASPLVWRGLCFVHFGGHVRGPMETPARGAMVALRVSDGHEVWRWSGDGPALGASPVIHPIEGEPQLVFKTKKSLVAVDPRTGKEIWQTAYRVPMDNTIVTPLLIGDLLITSDFDIGMMAWRIQRSGDSWRLRELWSHRKASLFTSSPVIAGGLLIGFSHLRHGQLFALDPQEGTVLWQQEPRSGEHATLIASGSQLLVIRDDGRLQLGEVDRMGLHLLGEYPLGPSAAWSHPAIVGEKIVFRHDSRLTAALIEPTNGQVRELPQ